MTNDSTFTDQLGRNIILPHIPKRIISLVPSITELLCDLGLAASIIGRTKFCVHPKEVINTIPKIGGTKNVNIDRVIALQPHLIIANKEENDKNQIEQLSQYFPIWISDIANFMDAMEMINSLGVILEKRTEAQKIIKDSKQLLRQLKPTQQRKAAYLIWQKPDQIDFGRPIIPPLHKAAWLS